MQNISARAALIGLLTLAFVASEAQSFAQDQPSTAMPKKPSALMNLTAQSNQLEVEGLKPWRITIAYQLMNAQGAVENEGTIEESWIAGQKFKVVYKSGAFTREDYQTASGLFRTSQGQSPSGQLDRIRLEFTQPFPNEKTREHWILEAKDQTSNGLKLKCLAITGFSMPDADRRFNGPTYCVESDRPALRLSTLPTSPSQIVLHDNLQAFQGRFVPGDVAVTQDSHPLWKAHLVRIEPIDAVDEAAFAPPASAKPVEKKIAISSGVAQGNLTHRVAPQYPPDARSKGIEGMVTIRATIGKDGHVNNLGVVQGPEELRQAALEAVQQWTYRPYLLNGETVSVDTMINVEFKLGH